MSHDRWRDELRATADDPNAIATLLARELPSDGLQHAGNAILAIPQSELLDALTATVVDALNQRGWDGDVALVHELQNRTGRAATDLTPLPVALEQLAEALEQSDGAESFLDLVTGTVWPAELFDVDQGPDDFDADDSDRWLVVLGMGSSGGHSDMLQFIATVTDRELADRLEMAVEGRGAFRRFRAELERHSAELTRWHRLRDDSQLGRARQWLAERGDGASRA